VTEIFLNCCTEEPIKICWLFFLSFVTICTDQEEIKYISPFKKNIYIVIEWDEDSQEQEKVRV
jgi:hypothetical protein